MTKYDNWQDGEVLDELDERGVGLQAWEIEFVESMTKIAKENVVELTEAQRRKLRQIAEERIPW